MHALLIADAQTLLFLDPNPADFRHTRGLQIKRLGNGGLSELNLLPQSTEQNPRDGRSLTEQADNPTKISPITSNDRTALRQSLNSESMEREHDARSLQCCSTLETVAPG